MSARDGLYDIKSRAEKFLAAYAEMIRVDQGIGGLAIYRPDLMPDFDAWYNASDAHHADTVLAVMEALTPRTISTVDELDALPDGSLIKFPSGLGRTQKHSVSALTGGDVITDKRFALPATVLHTPKES